MIHQTLVGYDGSESSKRAFQFAADLARATGNRVRVVYVMPLTQSDNDIGSLMMTINSEQHLRDLRDELRALVPDADALGEVVFTIGSPGDVLIGQVKEHQADHIVIGHTERGSLLRWLLGSVADDVLARAHVPVTVVP